MRRKRRWTSGNDERTCWTAAPGSTKTGMDCCPERRCSPNGPPDGSSAHKEQPCRRCCPTGRAPWGAGGCRFDSVGGVQVPLVLLQVDGPPGCASCGGGACVGVWMPCSDLSHLGPPRRLAPGGRELGCEGHVTYTCPAWLHYYCRLGRRSGRGGTGVFGH